MIPNHIRTISLQSFNDILLRYPASVPGKLQDLDTLRYDAIPAKVSSRQGVAFLTKDEVEKLVEWKLKHGTFRPTLLSLVQSNTSETIEETTKRAFEKLPKNLLEGPELEKLLLDPLKELTKLRGIGPATASLLLSVMRPETIPFFSDELFRWCCWDHPESPGGWARKIKYNVKEYQQLLGHVEFTTKRLEVRAVDMEKVAWVLGRDKADVFTGEEAGGGDMGIKRDEKGANEEIGEKTAMKQLDGGGGKMSKQTSKKGTKRKAREPISPVEGVRKSSRIKK
ncbi:hypothetical protein N0V83_008848 [Neocucurbitaria cava]|uniref:Uncharacterized protein n=1 Tax=Neocucurbitaria cava TaxID=798079 RepID=A0A9W8Y3T0_9PLEO|nr:hypothetical protein N0V83_008848 [Neocucurbitaria cava]